jgi:hypothetical protein
MSNYPINPDHLQQIMEGLIQRREELREPIRSSTPLSDISAYTDIRTEASKVRRYAKMKMKEATNARKAEEGFAFGRAIKECSTAKAAEMQMKYDRDLRKAQQAEIEAEDNYEEIEAFFRTFEDLYFDASQERAYQLKNPVI